MIKEIEKSLEEIKKLQDSAIPILPLRDIVVFPRMITPIFVGREKSIQALDHASHDNNIILLLTQKDALEDEPTIDSLYEYGTIAKILQLLRLPDGTVKVLIESLQRIRLTEPVLDDAKASFLSAKFKILEDKNEDEREVQALTRAAISDFDKYAKINKKIPAELVASLRSINDPARICHLIVANLDIKISEKQAMLSDLSILNRLEKCLQHMEGETSIINIEKRIRSRVKRQMEKTQREYYLNEQLKAIQKELGDSSQGDEIFELNKRIAETSLSKEAKAKAEKEVKKLSSMSVMSAESSICRNYLDWLLSLPWNKKSKLKSNLNDAQKILDRDHYGLEEIKERIIEHLAVQRRSNSSKSAIICFVGPPGVGKTSLAKSIASATGREYVKIALGGVRDEAEIRGHRRTYIGAMPGKIIQSIKKAKTSNPLFLLDEIDKMGSDYRGDPASALLEVLDPEQNSTFVDHYLEVEYDLSNVMFITTANSLEIPAPLLDRMEVIRLSGYSQYEKIQIAKQYLIPQMMKDYNLEEKDLQIDDNVLPDIVQYYTRESGVRALKREILKLGRKAVTKIVKGDCERVVIDQDNLEQFLGVRKYKYGQVENEDRVGIVTGLAWTSVGGQLLTIEALKVAGKGKMIITGNLRDVMKESISAASSYVRSKANELGIDSEIFEKHDIHVHVPEGATPKDGPSAGIAMVTAIVSVLTNIPIRNDVAMTGEITLRGRVLPIGGLKEKLLAAKNGGVRTVMIPEENAKDLADISDNIKDGLNIVPVAYANQVLEQALIKQPFSCQMHQISAHIDVKAPGANNFEVI